MDETTLITGEWSAATLEGESVVAIPNKGRVLQQP